MTGFSWAESKLEWLRIQVQAAEARRREAGLGVWTREMQTEIDAAQQALDDAKIRLTMFKLQLQMAEDWQRSQ